MNLSVTATGGLVVCDLGVSSIDDCRRFQGSAVGEQNKCQLLRRTVGTLPDRGQQTGHGR